MEKLHSAVEGLWVRELPWMGGRNHYHRTNRTRHDLMLLNAVPGAFLAVEELGPLFEATRCCRWLTSQLRDQGGQLYFGETTKLLQNALLEDPKPYRKDVKLLLQNLFAWSAQRSPRSLSWTLRIIRSGSAWRSQNRQYRRYAMTKAECGKKSGVSRSFEPQSWVPLHARNLRMIKGSAGTVSRGR
jgi:hypothetical protein